MLIEDVQVMLDPRTVAPVPEVGLVDAVAALAHVDDLEARVKDYLLAQLSHLANVDALAEVAKELDV